MNRTSKIILWAGGLGFLLLCVVCGGVIYQGFRELPKVQASAEGFLDLLGRGQVDEAYATTAPAFRSTTTEEQFRSMIAKYPVFAKPDRRTMGGLRIFNGNQAVVQYSLVNPQNSLSMGLTLVKVDGEWKVMGINLP